jgi:chromosome segregation ATPase
MSLNLPDATFPEYERLQESYRRNQEPIQQLQATKAALTKEISAKEQEVSAMRAQQEKTLGTVLGELQSVQVQLNKQHDIQNQKDQEKVSLQSAIETDIIKLQRLQRQLTELGEQVTAEHEKSEKAKQALAQRRDQRQKKTQELAAAWHRLLQLRSQDLTDIRTGIQALEQTWQEHHRILNERLRKLNQLVLRTNEENQALQQTLTTRIEENNCTTNNIATLQASIARQREATQQQANELTIQSNALTQLQQNNPEAVVQQPPENALLPNDTEQYLDDEIARQQNMFKLLVWILGGSTIVMTGMLLWCVLTPPKTSVQ